MVCLHNMTYNLKLTKFKFGPLILIKFVPFSSHGESPPAAHGVVP